LPPAEANGLAEFPASPGPAAPASGRACHADPRRPLRARIHTLHRGSQSVKRVAGLRSQATLAWLVALESVLPDRHQPPAATARAVRAKAMGDRLVWLRPRSRDRAALEFVDRCHHLPPPDLAGPISHIAVFGANIGLLLGDLGRRYPQAALLGAEPDRDNAVLARRNLAHLADHCELREAAVWHRDEVLTLKWEHDAWGQILTPPGPTEGGLADPGLEGGLPGPGPEGPADGTIQVDAVDAGRLLSEFAGPAPVDYLLINIESAWYQMLKHGDWTRDVRCIKIEIQDHYDEAVPLLEALGYRAWLQRLPWGAFVTGIRSLARPAAHPVTRHPVTRHPGARWAAA
jgi:hypothetical protein